MQLTNIYVETTHMACHVNVDVDTKTTRVTPDGNQGYALSSGHTTGYIPRRITLLNPPMPMNEDTFMVVKLTIDKKEEFVLQHHRKRPVMGITGMSQLLQTIPLPATGGDNVVGVESTQKLRMGSFYKEEIVDNDSPCATHHIDFRGPRNFFEEWTGQIPRDLDPTVKNTSAPEWVRLKEPEMNIDFSTNVTYNGQRHAIKVAVDFPVAGIQNRAGTKRIVTPTFEVKLPSPGLTLVKDPDQCQFILTIKEYDDGLKPVLQQHGPHPIPMGGPWCLLSEYDLPVHPTKGETPNQGDVTAYRFNDENFERGSVPIIGIPSNLTFETHTLHHGRVLFRLFNKSGSVSGEPVGEAVLPPLERPLDQYHLAYNARTHKLVLGVVIDGTSSYKKVQTFNLSPQTTDVAFATPDKGIDERFGHTTPHSETKQPSNIHISHGLTFTAELTKFGCEYITIFYDDGGVIGSVVLPINRFKNRYRYHLEYQGGQRLEVHTSIDQAAARVFDEIDDSEGTDEYVLALIGNPEAISIQWLDQFGSISTSELKISWSTDTYPVEAIELDNGGTVISIYETVESGEQKVSSVVLPLMTKSPRTLRLHFDSQQRELVLMEEDHPYSKHRQVYELTRIL